MRAGLFDVDGTLISSGGAGAASWRMAFDDLYGIPVDMGKYTDAGMTEPEVAIVTTTGGMEAAAHIKLARAGLEHYFSFGGFGSDSGDRIELTRRAMERVSALLRDRVDTRQVLVVGDTPHDVEGAHGARAVAAGVASSHFDVEELRAAGADYVLRSLEEELPLSAAPAST